jgi:hypothetical protein
LPRWCAGCARRGDSGCCQPGTQAELARLLPEWGTPPPPITTDAERLRLYEAVRVVWTTAALMGHGAALVRRLALRRRGQRAVVGLVAGPARRRPALLVAERPGQASPEAAVVLAEALVASGGSAHDLPPLDGEALFQLVKVLSGTERPQRFAHRLWQATGGHPLYALQTLQHLLQTDVIRIDEHGQWHTPFDNATADYHELPIAPSVQAALLQRVASLAEGPRRLIEAASLAGDDISLPLTAAACALGRMGRRAGAGGRAAGPRAAAPRRQARHCTASRTTCSHRPWPRRSRPSGDGCCTAPSASGWPTKAQHRHVWPTTWSRPHRPRPSAPTPATGGCAHWPHRASAWRSATCCCRPTACLALTPTVDAAVRAHLGRSSALLARSQGDQAAQRVGRSAHALMQPDTELELQVAVLAMRAFQSLQGQGNDADLGGAG